MLYYLTHKEIDTEKWDACISISHERIVYAFSWYLDIVCKKWGAIIEEQNGDYVSVFPIPIGKRWGQNAVLQPYFAQQLGLFTTDRSKYKAIDCYVALIPKKYKGVYLQLNTSNKLPDQNGLQSYTKAKRVTYHLSLEPSYDELLKGYRNKHKLNKANRSGLKVSALSNLEVLINIFKTTKGKELKEVKQKHYTLLFKLYDKLRQHDLAELYQVLNIAGDTIAAALFIKQQDKIIYLFSASSEEGRKLCAMTLLIDKIISENAGKNLVLDFEGSMVPSVAKFYANFGARPIPYVSLIQHHKPWYLKWKELISTS